MRFPEYSQYDGLGLADLARRGEVGAAELVAAAIERIEKHAAINAVVFKAYDEASARAKTSLSGPLAGVPFLLKDILGFKKGWPTRQGAAFVPAVGAPHDATLVTRYEAAGLIALGKTNVPEFGLLPITEPTLYGPARNPWNLDHSPGGSSGGSAAAVAAGIVPIAHANDGGGSIRIPASCCGLVGLKPTRGRNPLGPDLGDGLGGLAAEHVLTRSVRDCAAVLDATAGPDLGDPYCAPPAPGSYLALIRTPPRQLRIAFAGADLQGRALHPECRAGVAKAASLCADLGHEVEEASPKIDAAQFIPAFMALWTSGLAAVIDYVGSVTQRKPAPADFQALTWGFYEAGKTVPASQYQLAWALLHRVGRAVAAWHRRYDAWITPVLARPPVRIGEFDTANPNWMAASAPIIDYVPFTPVQNATGQPAISLPVHWSAEGLPVGVQLVGRFGEEHTLLQLARQIEQAAPWNRRPPVWN
jgi:amidase